MREAAEELGYTGNAVARALARGRTGLVGVLSGLAGGPRRAALRRGARPRARRRDLHMVVVDARGEPDRERMLARQLADQLVDGLIISPLDPSGPRVGRDRRGAAGRDRRRRARRADGGGGAVRQPRRRRDGARAPAPAGPPPDRRADAEPPVDARPAGRARGRRGLRRARARRHRGQLAATRSRRRRRARPSCSRATRSRPRSSASRTRSPAASTPPRPRAGSRSRATSRSPATTATRSRRWSRRRSRRWSGGCPTSRTPRPSCSRRRWPASRGVGRRRGCGWSRRCSSGRRRGRLRSSRPDGRGGTNFGHRGEGREAAGLPRNDHNADSGPLERSAVGVEVVWRHNADRDAEIAPLSALWSLRRETVGRPSSGQCPKFVPALPSPAARSASACAAASSPSSSGAELTRRRSPAPSPPASPRTPCSSAAAARACRSR